MQRPELPPVERERLAALRSLAILDTPHEERFDRLTRLARRIFRTPVAVVSLVDENRLWFKSVEGLNVLETPRDVSFCGHAILGDDTFVVHDTLEDRRFADNPLVMADPKIRFYAGCPLKTQDGHRVGTLCIIDQVPRSLSQDEMESLEDLAAMCERELAAVQLATVDELTGITNRRGFVVLARHSLGFCSRQELPASLVFIDLNGFKAINDTHGHAEGDRALIAVAEQMKSSFRESDLFARLGGDEFVVLLTNTTRETAEEIMEKFQQALAAGNREADRGYEITFSHGVVAFDSASHPAVETLLARGDELMYERKKQDRSGA